MTTQYRWTHALAMGLATGAVAYQSAVVLEMLAGVSFTTRIGVPLATVTAAMLPVLSEAAWRGGERVKAALLVLPVFALLAFVLPSGISRLGEAQEARITAATMSQGELEATKADLAKANQLVAQSERWTAAECASGAGAKCRGQQFTLAQRQAYQKELAAKLASYKPATMPWLPAWHPAMLPIGLEVAIVTLLFYGFGPLTVAKVEPVKSDSGEGSGERKPEPMRIVHSTPRVLTSAEAKARIAAGMKQHQLAAEYGLNQGRVSELLTGKREQISVH